MDVRALICGLLAAIALIGGVVLAAINADPSQAAAVLGLAGTFGGYVVGLYSQPFDGGDQ
jgi:hypothetical protein